MSCNNGDCNTTCPLNKDISDKNHNTSCDNNTNYSITYINENILFDRDYVYYDFNNSDEHPQCLDHQKTYQCHFINGNNRITNIRGKQLSYQMERRRKKKKKRRLLL